MRKGEKDTLKRSSEMLNNFEQIKKIKQEEDEQKKPQKEVKSKWFKKS